MGRQVALAYAANATEIPLCLGCASTSVAILGLHLHLRKRASKQWYNFAYSRRIATMPLSQTERLDLCTKSHCCVYLYAGETT
jgi:hypothetical protein